MKQILPPSKAKAKPDDTKEIPAKADAGSKPADVKKIPAKAKPDESKTYKKDSS